MLRTLAVLIFLPTVAAAQWAPRPALFTYDATFNLCTADPTAPDLAAQCADILSAAYVLKRAVASAAYTCFPESLATCATPFEDEGLPAIAARIAFDVGCDDTDVLQLPDDAPLPPNHCITVASDIMNDEGVVPLFTEITCGRRSFECIDLATINANFWDAQVEQAAQDAPALARDLQARNRVDCDTNAPDLRRGATNIDALLCRANRASALWADLAIQMEQDQ